ncbi:MAG: hypothetical protein HQL44_15765 [Alphaproteobacteria bacterium]|nr:hypothetical protein [Alphaproteobacteria bacterium]
MAVDDPYRRAAQLKQPAGACVMKWMPISSFPVPTQDEERKPVLVWGDGWPLPDLAFLMGDQWWSATKHDGFVFAKIEPTHWMPLPLPPVS